jgi:hypothetical protein
MAAPARKAEPVGTVVAGRSTPDDPIDVFRSEHAALAESALVVEEILVQGPLTDQRLAELDGRMRHMRFLLPRHLVNEEQALFPEIGAADPREGPALEDLTARHHAAEAAFVPLQARLMELTVAPTSVGTRRRAARAARDFRALLDQLFAAEESGPIAAARALLAGERLARVAAALGFASARDSMKAAQHR